MDAWISFKSTQHSSDGYDEVFEFDSPAQFFETDDGFKLVYDESGVMGVSEMLTTLTTGKDSVVIERRGEFNILIVLEEGRRTTSTYQTKYGDMIMGVYAKKINTKLTNLGGSIKFQYDLNLPPSHTMNHHVSIEVKPEKTDAKGSLV